MKLMFSIICLLIIAGGVFMVENIKESNPNPNNEYSGPVRPTDNLQHFRETGETISQEVVNG